MRKHYFHELRFFFRFCQSFKELILYVINAFFYPTKTM